MHIYVIIASHDSSISSLLLQHILETVSTTTATTATTTTPVPSMISSLLPAMVLQVKASRSNRRPERDEYSLGVVDSESIWSMITLLTFSWINIHHQQQQQLSGQQQQELLPLNRYNDDTNEDENNTCLFIHLFIHPYIDSDEDGEAV